MQSVTYKTIEFLIIFILIPVSLVFSYPIYLKLGIGILGFLYIIWMLLKVEKLKFKRNKNLNWKGFWKRTLLLWSCIIILSIAYVFITDQTQLFIVMRTKPWLWLFILFFYSTFSVYPQELIYRTFFFQRYESLFKNQRLTIFINAIVFALAHFFFHNTLVLVLTFLGGILFAFTFVKTRSTLLVTIEHAIYGSWLFTVGMGSMLGFPT